MEISRHSAFIRPETDQYVAFHPHPSSGHYGHFFTALFYPTLVSTILTHICKAHVHTDWRFISPLRILYVLKLHFVYCETFVRDFSSMKSFYNLKFVLLGVLYKLKAATDSKNAVLSAYTSPVRRSIFIF